MKDHLPVPFRAFGFIAFLMAIAAFSALNLDNRADVSVGIHTFPAVPIYLTSLISFTLGAVLVLPFTRRRRRGAGRDVPSFASTQHPGGAHVRGKPGAIEAPVQEHGGEQTLSRPAERRRRRWTLSWPRRETSTQSRSAAPTSSAHPEVAPEEPARKSRRRRSPKRNRRALDARDRAHQNASHDTR